MNRRTLLGGLIAVVAFTILIQFVPVPGLGTNPPSVGQPAWNSPRTQALAERSCYACHSNRTRWPWYSRIAPISWLVAHDVGEGRAALNFSDPAASRVSASQAARAVENGAMPRFYYLWMHPQARLSASQRKLLATGLRASLSATGSAH